MGRCPFHKKTRNIEKGFYDGSPELVLSLEDNSTIEGVRAQALQEEKNKFPEKKKKSLESARTVLSKKRKKKKVHYGSRKPQICQQKLIGPPNLKKRSRNKYQKSKDSFKRSSSRIFSSLEEKLPKNLRNQVLKNKKRGNAGILDLSLQSETFFAQKSVCNHCLQGNLKYVGKANVQGLYFQAVYVCTSKFCSRFAVVDSSSKISLSPSKTGKKRNISIASINLSTVQGATTAGISGEKLKKVLPFTGAGRIDNGLFRKNQNYLNVPVYKLAKKSFLRAEKLEAKLTLERKTVDQKDAPDGVVDSLNTFDGTWTKKGRQKNSDTGAVTQMGNESNLVTNIRAYSKRCKLCEFYEARGMPIPVSHLPFCRRNYPRNESSGGMEPEGSRSMVIETNSHKIIRIKEVGGDGDSTTEGCIQQAVDYDVKKREDSNHLENVVGTWIREMKSQKSYLKNLGEVDIRKIQKNIIICLKKSKDKEEGKMALKNLLNHWWNIHDDCEKIHGGGWCRGSDGKHSFRAMGEQFRKDLDASVVSRLVVYIEKLIKLSCTNRNEYFNAILHRAASKNDNHGGSSKWHTICHLKAFEFNEGHLEANLRIFDALGVDKSIVDIQSLERNEKERVYKRDYMKIKKNYTNHLRNKKKKCKTKQNASQLSNKIYKSGIAFSIDQNTQKPKYISTRVCNGPTFENDPDKIFQDFDIKKGKNQINSILQNYDGNNLNEVKVWGGEESDRLLLETEKSFLANTSVLDTETTGLNKKQQRRKTTYNENRRYQDTFFEVSVIPLAGYPSSSESPKPHTQLCNPSEHISPLCWSHTAKAITRTNPMNEKTKKILEKKPGTTDTSKSLITKLGDLFHNPIVIAKNTGFDKAMIIQQRYFSGDRIMQDKSKKLTWIEGNKFLAPVPKKLDDGSKLLEKGNNKQENQFAFFENKMKEDSGQHSAKTDILQLKKMIYSNCGDSMKLVGAVGSQIHYQTKSTKEEKRICGCNEKKGKCKSCACVKEFKKLRKKLMNENDDDEEKVDEIMKVKYPFVGKCGPLCKCGDSCCNKSYGLSKLRQQQKVLTKKKKEEFRQNNITFEQLIDIRKESLLSWLKKENMMKEEEQKEFEDLQKKKHIIEKHEKKKEEEKRSNEIEKKTDFKNESNDIENLENEDVSILKKRSRKIDEPVKQHDSFEPPKKKKKDNNGKSKRFESFEPTMGELEKNFESPVGAGMEEIDLFSD